MNALLLAAVALGDQIERAGSYFGFAAVVGLGVLSLLYFSQAREVKRLREWAGRAPERDADLAQRVQADAQRRVVAQPLAAPGVTQPVAPQTAAAQQADAARQAAAAAVMQKFQAPAAATPVVGPPGQLARPATPGAPPAVQPGQAAPAAGAGTTPAVQPTAAPGTAPASGTAPALPGAAVQSPAVTPVPGAATPGPAVPPTAATAGAVAAARQAATAGRSPALTNGAGAQDTHESSVARPAALTDLPPRPPRQVSPAPREDRRRRGGRRRIGLIAGAAGGALVVVVLLVIVLSGGNDKAPAGTSVGSTNSPAAASPSRPAAPRVNRRATQVAVFNGTIQTGLAASVASKIEQKGFTILSKATYSDQKIATTTVSYAAGGKAAARIVATIVGVSPGSVQPLDANTSAAVSAEADVVVIVGNDVSSTG